MRGVGRPWQMRFFHALIRRAGRRPAYHVMYFVVFWYVLFVPEIRRRAHHYLRRRFPRHRGWLRRFAECYRLVCGFGRTMIDRAALALLGPAALSASCPDAEALRRVVEEHDGAVLLNAHVGCWQVAMAALGFLRRRVAIVMIPPAGAEPGAFLEEPGQPFHVIDPRTGLEGVLEMVQALEAGEIVGVMGDRVFGKQEQATAAAFLGEPVELPISPYRLAGAARKPIIVLFSHKAGFSDYVIRLAAVIHVPPDARSPAACRPYARQFAGALESFVREHPYQFFNFYDLWGDRAEPQEDAANG